MRVFMYTIDYRYIYTEIIIVNMGWNKKSVGCWWDGMDGYFFIYFPRNGVKIPRDTYMYILQLMIYIPVAGPLFSLYSVLEYITAV